MEKATTYKDLKEYHLSTIIYTSIGNSNLAYEILNHKLPDLPEYAAVIGDPNHHIHDFEKQLIKHDDTLKYKLFLMIHNRGETR